MEYGQLTVETIDAVAPRLIAFTADLLNKLRLAGFTVEISTSFLLNSTDHPVEVPCMVDGISVQMSFDAFMPLWAVIPKARVSIRFMWGTPFYYLELGNQANQTAKFHTRKILRLFIKEVKKARRKLRISESKLQTTEHAEVAFQMLSQDIQAPTHPDDPSLIKLRNIKIKRLDKVPTRVIVMLSVTHDQARELVSKYRSK